MEGESNFRPKCLNQIRALYKIEDEIRTQGLFQKEMFSEIVHIRQEKAKPILDALYIYLQDLATKSDGTLDLGKAIRYTLGQWDKPCYLISRRSLH